MLKNEGRKLAAKANMSQERLLGSLNMFKVYLKTIEENLGIRIGPTNLSQRNYENIICDFIISYMEDDVDARKNMVEAAMLRKCLG